MPMRIVLLVLALTLSAGVRAAEHAKPKATAKAGATRKHLETEAKAKKELKSLPEKVDAAFHHDKHFGKDGIKAIYNVGPNLYWVELTEGGKDYLLEYDGDGNLLAIAWENHDTLVVLIEGDDGYLWAVDEDGNAVAFAP